MNVAVRYYSRGGHVKRMAEALARGAGVEAISVDDPRAKLTKPVDILFIGGALYSFQIDEKIKDYIKTLSPEVVTDRAICFGSSWLTRRPVYLIQEKVRDQGIEVSPQALYARGNPKQIILDAAEVFAEMEVKRDSDDEAARPKPYVYVVKADERNEAAALAEEEEDYDEDEDLAEEE
ncbi:MAG: hypothetical protein IJ092_10415 [Atopobiaceae bacterium]|nr:hypothetical protein [Atopobiaceae bacterium]